METGDVGAEAREGAAARFGEARLRRLRRAARSARAARASRNVVTRRESDVAVHSCLRRVCERARAHVRALRGARVHMQLYVRAHM